MSLTLVLGAIFLILILSRIFVRPRESFQEYQKKRQQHNDEILASLHEDTLPPEESMRPVVAGIREYLDLDDPADCELEDLGGAAQLTTPRGIIVIRWILRTAELRVSHGAHSETSLRRGHWELQLDGKPPEPYADTQLMQMMARIKTIVHDEGPLPLP